MRVAWTPERPREGTAADQSGKMAPSLVAAASVCEPRFGTTSRKKPEPRLERASLPVRGTEPSAEVVVLREQVARLQAASQRDAQERAELKRQVDLLQVELRQAREQNRKLADSVDQHKRVVEDAAVPDEAKHRELALNSARELFRNMLHGGNNCAGWVAPQDDGGDCEPCMSGTGSGHSCHAQAADCARSSHNAKRRSTKIQAGGA
mmetsp:Transcript_56483/g.132487  ORF Transcript_56483/g.132487 Transcript_56483/m.132487 type:complete len:207 (+) Transcript_56483:80-700(+)